MSVLVIFNPISGAGRGRALAEAVSDAATARGLDIELLPTSPGPAEAWLRAPLAGRDALVVVGGDGAVRLAAPEAARSDVPMVHCPAGNENLFAREFGMRAAGESVARTLLDGVVRRIDLATAEIEGRASEDLVLMASFGLDAEVVHDLSAVRTGSVSNLSYVRPILRQIRSFEPPRVTAVVDGSVVAEDLPGMVVVANSRQYAIRLDPARRARMDDGLLDLVILPCRGTLDLLGWFPRTRLGRHMADSRLVYEQGRRIDLELSRPRRWQVDGDPPHDPEVASRIGFEVVPGALPVLVPPLEGR